MSLLSKISRALGFKMSSEDIFKQVYGSPWVTKTGQSVNLKTAIQVSTVVACTRVIAEGLAQVPLKLYRQNNDGNIRVPASEHPLYDLLRTKPNSWQTSFEFRETMGWHVVLTGNFFCFKNIVLGKLRELIPLEPGSVKVIREDDYSLTYEVTYPDNRKQRFPQEVIWHVRGASLNSWMGLEAVQIARDAIGLAMATEEQHASMHKNGVQSTGIYSVDGKLTHEQHKDLTKWLEDDYGGSRNGGKPMIIDMGAKFLSTSMTGVDAQHLETRKYQIEEICRFFRVMPIMVGYSDKAATYASAEQMFLSHVVHTLSPWYQRIEQSIDANLLTEKDRANGVYSKFVEEGLLRGDSKTTSEFLQRLTMNGIMTRNEARAKLDLNPLDGLDEPLTPVNMQIGTEPQGATNAQPNA